MRDKPALYRRTQERYAQLSDAEHREALRHYLAFCSYEDALFGQVCDALRETGQYESTIILYLSDHGDYAGAHGLWAKGLPCFREAYAIPLLARLPGGAAGRSDYPVCITDIAPTLLELCGVPLTRYMQGVSLAAILRGQGEPGQRGGPAGDLYIAITVRPSRKFRRDGANLYSEMTISFAQAALGDEVEIETLKGTVKETIAEGTQPGQVIRVRGEGVPSLRNPSQRGDLFVTLKVEVPKRLNERQRMALRLFDEAMGGKASGASRGDNWKKSVKEFFDKFKD